MYFLVIYYVHDLIQQTWWIIEENTGVAWATEGGYTFDELLTRVFSIMREKNPEMVAGEKKKFTMRPPQVVRIGTKKTSFANFSEICKM